MSDDLDIVRVGVAQTEALKATDDVLRDVRVERARQFMKWGWAAHPDPMSDPVGHRHDDEHAEGDWSRFAVRFVGRAEQAIEDGDPIAWRESMVSVAALAVAAIESHDRKRGVRESYRNTIGPSEAQRELDTEDIAYLKAQNSDEWQTRGGGGL